MATEPHALAERYQEMLQQDGRIVHPPELDEAGNARMVVNANEMDMVFLFSKSDGEYVRIVMPNFFSLDLDEDKINALVAMNHVSTQCKVAKVNLTERQDNVVASIEYLDHGSAVAKPQLDRYLSMLLYAAREFAKKMLALKGADPEAT